MTSVEIENTLADAKSELANWVKQNGNLLDFQVPPADRAKLTQIEADIAYWTFMQQFWQYATNKLASIRYQERKSEEWGNFKLGDLFIWLQAQPTIRVGEKQTLGSLNALCLLTQDTRDALAEKYEVICYLCSKYEAVWLDIQRLWMSFNDAKSEGRAIGKLLMQCPVAVTIKDCYNELESLKSAFDVAWKHSLQSSVELRFAASLIMQQSQGGVSGLDVVQRMMEPETEIVASDPNQMEELFGELDKTEFTT